MKIFKADSKIKPAWNDFVAKSPYGSFLQSWEWGDFQKAQNKKIWRLVVKDKDQIKAVGLVIRQPLPFGFSYLYSPRGPVLSLSLIHI